MNCSEFEDWTGPYLAHEIEDALRDGFDSHRGECASCARMLEGTMAADEKIRRVVAADSVDADAMVAGVRLAVVARRTARRRWMGIAAAVLLTLAGAGYWVQSRESVARVFLAAVRDHRIEVLQNGPRRWKVTPAEVKPLLEDYRVRWSDVETLLPVGFVLEKAKQCGIDGKPALHLVFSDGAGSLSVYVQTAAGHAASGETVVDGTSVASFRRGAIAGIVVASTPGLCAEAVRRLTAL